MESFSTLGGKHVQNCFGSASAAVRAPSRDGIFLRVSGGGLMRSAKTAGPAIPATRPPIPATQSPKTAESPRRAAPQVSVIIPALNEARNLPSVLGALPADVHEVVLVDGHSTDGTVDVARLHRPDIRIVQQTRRGKGNALVCGFAAATGDIVVMLDADGSADPKEIPAFVDTLLAGAHFAKGSRFIGSGGSADITRLRRAGNRLLNLFVRAFFRVGFTDLCYGYNAFWSECLMVLELAEPVIEVPAGEQVDQQRTSPVVRWGDGFEIETLINVRIHQAGLSVVEVSSFEHPRLHGVSNLNAVRDGLRVLRTIGAEWRRLRRAAEHRPEAGRVGKPWHAFATGAVTGAVTGAPDGAVTGAHPGAHIDGRAAAGDQRRPIEVPASRRGDRWDEPSTTGKAER